MGMIRRSFAFPPRARNKAAGGRARGGRGAGGDSRRLPVAPRLPALGSGSPGVGAGSLQSSDPERLWRAPGHPPGQVPLPPAAVSKARPPPRPLSAPQAAIARNRSNPHTAPGAAALGPETKHQVPSTAVGLLGFLYEGDDGAHSPSFLGVRAGCQEALLNDRLR